VSGLVKSAIETRIGGGKPSPLRAALVAAVAGVAAAALTYKVLRS
jgi:hypothetical protein